MKKVTGVLGAGVMAVMLTAPVFAQTSSPGQPSVSDNSTTAPSATAPSTPSTTTPSTTAPSEKHGKLGLGRLMGHHMTADVVSVDQNAKTFTVKKGAKGKEMTFTAQGDAADRLSDLKEGDRVKVSYKKDHGQYLATEIAKGKVAQVK
jgi:Cu/Ag efflux protein CusF